jgi:quinoprotein glucose dehydrogenase
VRFFAAEALGRIAHRPATQPLIDMLAANDAEDVYLQHAAALALASAADPSTLESLASHSSTAVRAAAVVALRRLRHADVARFLGDADEHIATDAARAINDDGSIAAAVPLLAAVLGRTPFSNEPLMRRAINANLRLGTRAALDRIATFAAALSTPDVLRVEAVATLGVWTSPSPLDRVDGSYLEPFDAAPSGVAQAPRDGAAAAVALQRLIDTTLAPGTPPASDAMKVALAEAAGRLDAMTAAPALLALLRNDGAGPVRLASLQALQALRVGDMDDLMRLALADRDPTVRRAALAVLPELPMSASAKTQHVAALVRSGALAEQQGAIEVLGRLKTPESRQLLATYLDDLSAGRLAAGLHVDLLAAVQADGSPALADRLEAFRVSRKADAIALAFSEGLMAGGDAARGRQVFINNPLAECSRCHATGAAGSDVGPNLARIGATLTRAQLLEALVAPSARVAPGFGLVNITLRNGQQVAGTLREDTATHVAVSVGTPAAEQRIAKTDITQRTDPISAMPPLGLLLDPRDVRDLVEYLATLK